jgi:hypothetical protein
MKIKFTKADGTSFFEAFSTKEEALIKVRSLIKQTKTEGRLQYLEVLIKLYNQIQLM